MRAIVTGANGFIGSSLVHMLLDAGMNVVAIDREFEEERLPRSDLLVTLEENLEDIESVRESLSQWSCDVFYHLAWRGVNGIEKADPLVQVRNIEIALVCAELARELGCSKFLCAGTIAERTVESLPLLCKTSGGMLYGSAKHAARILLETYCKGVGLGFVWMQFSNIFGPRNKTGNLVSYTLAQLLRGEPATFGPAKQPYDFVYIDDLLEAVFRLGTRHTKETFYYIGSGAPRVLRDYLIEIGDVCGRRDLIRIGQREDDGVRYDYSMFDNTSLVRDIGVYVSTSFDDALRRTMAGY